MLLFIFGTDYETKEKIDDGNGGANLDCKQTQGILKYTTNLCIWRNAQMHTGSCNSSTCLFIKMICFPLTKLYVSREEMISGRMHPNNH